MRGFRGEFAWGIAFRRCTRGEFALGIAFAIDLTSEEECFARNLGAPYHFNQSIAQCRWRRSSAVDTVRHNQTDSATKPTKRVVTSNVPIATAWAHHKRATYGKHGLFLVTGVDRWELVV